MKKYLLVIILLVSPIMGQEKKSNLYIEVGKTLTLPQVRNCPIDVVNDITVKGDFFTIRYSFCTGWLFILFYSIFKYSPSKGQFMLDKYSKTYIDRSADSQDESEAKHYQIEKNKYFFNDLKNIYNKSIL